MSDNQINNGEVRGQQNQQDATDVLAVRRQKLDELRAEGHDPFLITKYDRTHHSNEIKDNYEALEGKAVSVAGRLMSKRIMGKASFCHVQDLGGTIQVYVARDNVGEEEYRGFKKLDIGDIVGVE